MENYRLGSEEIKQIERGNPLRAGKKKKPNKTNQALVLVQKARNKQVVSLCLPYPYALPFSI